MGMEGREGSERRRSERKEGDFVIVVLVVIGIGSASGESGFRYSCS